MANEIDQLLAPVYARLGDERLRVILRRLAATPETYVPRAKIMALTEPPLTVPQYHRAMAKVRAAVAAGSGNRAEVRMRAGSGAAIELRSGVPPIGSADVVITTWLTPRGTDMHSVRIASALAGVQASEALARVLGWWWHQAWARGAAAAVLEDRPTVLWLLSRQVRPVRLDQTSLRSTDRRFGAVVANLPALPLSPPEHRALLEPIRKILTDGGSGLIAIQGSIGGGTFPTVRCVAEVRIVGGDPREPTVRLYAVKRAGKRDVIARRAPQPPDEGKRRDDP